MGFNIKNNYGPNIEVNAGGKVTLVQDKNGLWHTADAEEAEYEEVTDETLRQDPENTCDNENRPSTGSANDYKVMLSTPRQNIFNQLLNLADKGDWVNGITSEDVKTRLKIVLGQGETPLSAKEAELSEVLWHLLESGRGDRVKIVWQNMVGYMDDKKLFKLKGSPALNKDFFGDDKGYTNIDKGRPSKGLMTADFESIIPLLDAYVPKLDKKA
jgi:hypothetical protein